MSQIICIPCLNLKLWQSDYTIHRHSKGKCNICGRNRQALLVSITSDNKHKDSERQIMTIEIKESCPCGAKFHVKDSYVFGNTARERYQDFLKAHKICREADSMRDKVVTTYKTDE